MAQQSERLQEILSMIFERSVTPVILSLFWFGAALFGFWCCLYACWMFLEQIYKLIKH